LGRWGLWSGELAIGLSTALPLYVSGNAKSCLTMLPRRPSPRQLTPDALTASFPRGNASSSWHAANLPEPPLTSMIGLLPCRPSLVPFPAPNGDLASRQCLLQSPRALDRHLSILQRDVFHPCQTLEVLDPNVSDPGIIQIQSIESDSSKALYQCPQISIGDPGVLKVHSTNGTEKLVTEKVSQPWRPEHVVIYRTANLSHSLDCLLLLSSGPNHATNVAHASASQKGKQQQRSQSVPMPMALSFGSVHHYSAAILAQIRHVLAHELNGMKSVLRPGKLPGRGTKAMTVIHATRTGVRPVGGHQRIRPD